MQVIDEWFQRTAETNTALKAYMTTGGSERDVDICKSLFVFLHIIRNVILNLWQQICSPNSAFFMHKYAPARKTVTLPTRNTTSKSAKRGCTFRKFPFLDT